MHLQPSGDDLIELTRANPFKRFPVRDQFGKLCLDEGRYASGEIDVPVWRDDIEADFQGWVTAGGR